MLPNLLDQPDRHNPVSATSGHRHMAEHPFLSLPVLRYPSSPAQSTSPLPSTGCSHWRSAALITSHSQAAEAPPGLYQGLPQMLLLQSPTQRETIGGEGRAPSRALQAGFGLRDAAFVSSRFSRVFPSQGPCRRGFSKDGCCLHIAAYMGSSQPLPTTPGVSDTCCPRRTGLNAGPEKEGSFSRAWV